MFEQPILLAYVVTIISEIGIILLFERPREMVLWTMGIFLVNSFTHPLLIYLFHFCNLPYVPLELGVTFTEACWYRVAFKTTRKRALILSGTANSFSIIVGFAVRFLAA